MRICLPSKKVSAEIRESSVFSDSVCSLNIRYFDSVRQRMKQFMQERSNCKVIPTVYVFRKNENTRTRAMQHFSDDVQIENVRVIHEHAKTCLRKKQDCRLFPLCVKQENRVMLFFDES